MDRSKSHRRIQHFKADLDEMRNTSEIHLPHELLTTLHTAGTMRNQCSILVPHSLQSRTLSKTMVHDNIMCLWLLCMHPPAGYVRTCSVACPEGSAQRPSLLPFRSRCFRECLQKFASYSWTFLWSLRILLAAAAQLCESLAFLGKRASVRCSEEMLREIRSGQKGITSLPDEILYAILTRVPSRWPDTETRLRFALPLVCKKWREVLYLQGGQSTFSVTFGYKPSPMFIGSSLATTSSAGRPLKKIELNFLPRPRTPA